MPKMTIYQLWVGSKDGPPTAQIPAESLADWLAAKPGPVVRVVVTHAGGE